MGRGPEPYPYVHFNSGVKREGIGVKAPSSAQKNLIIQILSPPAKNSLYAPGSKRRRLFQIFKSLMLSKNFWNLSLFSPPTSYEMSFLVIFLTEGYFLWHLCNTNVLAWRHFQCIYSPICVVKSVLTVQSS